VQGTLGKHTIYREGWGLDKPQGAEPVVMPRAGHLNYLELHYHWPDLSPVAGAPYLIKFADGTEIKGKLDEQGYAKIEAPPPCEYQVWFGEDSRDPPPIPAAQAVSNQAIAKGNADLSEAERAALQQMFEGFSQMSGSGLPDGSVQDDTQLGGQPT
jgi:hypothetical protein